MQLCSCAGVVYYNIFWFKITLLCKLLQNKEEQVYKFTHI